VIDATSIQERDTKKQWAQALGTPIEARCEEGLKTFVKENGGVAGGGKRWPICEQPG